MTHTTSPQPQPSLSLSQSPTSGSCNQAGSPDSPLPPRISAVLNTYNAAEHLDEVLDALHGFDEIILVDMHSTDETRAIATRHGARIIDFERCGICEPARTAAIQAASNPWVLIVDADEIVPPALRDYLYKLISSPNPPAALRLPLRNYFMGCEMHCLYPNYITRFARRDAIEGLKKAVKQGMSEDVEKDGEAAVQKLHDKYLKQIDDVFAAKEKEILTV